LTVGSRGSEGFSLISDAALSAGRAAADDLMVWIEEKGHSDVRPSDLSILRLVEPGALSLSALATSLEITAQAVGKAVASLRDREFVRRETTRSDRRLVLVALTDQGRSVLQAAEDWSQARQHAAVIEWGEPEVLRAAAILERFSEPGLQHPRRGRRTFPR